MIPIYVFYSMFGFQRTGDAFWAAADQLVRGFVIGATAGRTTLNGEGLQHEDGHSQLLAATNPAVVSYDPAFAFELGHIVKDGLRRMYGENSENVYYYITVYNEPYVHPAEPERLDVEGLLKGIYLYSPAPSARKKNAQILASGVGVNWALKAQQLLADDWGVHASVWSVTSWNELRRDGLETDRHNLLNPSDKRTAYVTKKLANAKGPVVAVSDYMRAVQDQIAPWVAQPFYSLGTDGFGLSDTRGALRRHFKVDAESIAVAVLQQLCDLGEVKQSVVTKAMAKYRIHDVRAADAGNTEGSG
jgi:pyruvate dehydrogenase E1 component